MNTIFKPLALARTLGTAGMILLATSAGAAEVEFPYVIQPELGAAEYATGDAIAITSLRGNRPHLEPGGRYLLEGTYALASVEQADLAWFATSREPSGGTPVSKDEHTDILKGSGKFRLIKTLQGEGWLHVSFYVNGHSHGGVYFGERGVEKTVLRQKSWSDFPRGQARNTPEDPNAAILAYLGKPVPAPADLSEKYTARGLEAAFSALAAKAGFKVQKLQVNDSEFPFIVHGIVGGKHEYRAFEQALREMKDYTYGGSVVGTTDKGATYFALNITPYGKLAGDQFVACNRRLMVRLQMLADKMAKAE